MALTKVSGGILDPGINVAGIVTATGFDGPFTGGSSKNITAGIITATGFDLNGNGDISGNLVIGGNLTANGDFTTLNTTLREVELLRVDANSSAIAGIITQRGSGDIFSAYDASTQVFKIADGGDVTFFGATTDRNIIFDRSANTLQVKRNAILKIGQGSYSTDLYSDGTNTIFDHNQIGALFIKSNIFQVYGTGTSGGNTYDGTIFRCMNGKTELGYEVPNGGVTTLDNLVTTPKGVTVGTGVTIERNGQASFVGIVTFTGDVKVGSGITFHSTNSRISLPDGTTGGPYTGNFEIGNSRDFTIVHDSNHTYMTNRTGDFYIGISDSVFPIRLKSNNTVEIYHGSTKRIETHSLGINVLGTSSFSDHVDIADNKQLRFGASTDFKIEHNTNENYIDSNSGHIYIRANVNDDEGDNIYIQPKSGENSAVFTHDGAVELYHNDQKKFETTSSGVDILGDLVLPISGTELKIWTGGTQGIVMGHGGTFGEIDNLTGMMRIKAGSVNLANRFGNYNFINCAANGSVDLYYDAQNHTTPKLATSATGVTIDGEVSASQDYPNFRPTLDFNFAATKKLDPRITYTRTGPASFIDEFGFVKIVGENAPRFDHDPMTGECKGLLIEETRTNKISNSNGWNDGVVTDETKSPDGEFNAIKVTGSESGTTYSEGTSTTGVWSVFLKAGSTNYVQLQGGGVGMNNSNIGPYTKNSVINLSDGTFTVNQQNFTAEQYRDGWWRVSVVYTTGNTYTGTTWSIYCLDSSSPSADTIDNAEHCYVWGEVYEVGSFITSYIPTTDGSTATRGYEAPTLEGAEFSDVFGTEFKEFSLVADYDNTQTPDGTTYGIIDLWGEETNYNDRIEWFKLDSSPYHIETRAFGGGNAIFANGELSASSKAKSQRFATSWSVPDYSNTSSRRFVVSMGGEAVDVINDSSGTTVPQITRMGIGCNPTRLDFSPGLLHFKRLMVYDKTLSDGQLQNLSAQ